MSSKKKPVKSKAAAPAKKDARKAAAPAKPKAAVRKPAAAPKPAARAAAKASPVKPKTAPETNTRKTVPSTAKPEPAATKAKAPAKPAVVAAPAPIPQPAKPIPVTKPSSSKSAATDSPATASKAPRTTLDDLALDIEEKDRLQEEEKRDLIKALREDEDEPLETAFVPTDTSERAILVVDEDGQRRTETIAIVQQILPNAVIEVADDPEEALEIMGEAEFDTYVVNFLMPGFSASPFVKAVINHPDRPLLIGFAADKISDALDQRKGLKIIPLKRLFDLDAPQAQQAEGKGKLDE